MWTKLYWVDGPWPGKLALAARPRGGDWLEGEIASWRRNGVDIVISLLTAQEEHDLDITKERPQVEAQGMNFISFPILDRQVPASESTLAQTLNQLDHELTAGKNILVHCRQGIGRTGLVAACLFLAKNIDPETAMDRLSKARGVLVPETREQREWIDRYVQNVALRQ